MECFQTVLVEFRDCFQTVQVEFSGFFSDSLYRIFRTVSGQSQTMLRFGFDPGTDVFDFYGVFWYYNNSVTSREGTKRCFVLYGSEILAILWVIVRKINNMLLRDKWKLYVG